MNRFVELQAAGTAEEKEQRLDKRRARDKECRAERSSEMRVDRQQQQRREAETEEQREVRLQQMREQEHERHGSEDLAPRSSHQQCMQESRQANQPIYRLYFLTNLLLRWRYTRFYEY